VTVDVILRCAAPKNLTWCAVTRDSSLATLAQNDTQVNFLVEVAQ